MSMTAVTPMPATSTATDATQATARFGREAGGSMRLEANKAGARYSGPAAAPVHGYE
jgi:hypothetical protein